MPDLSTLQQLRAEIEALGFTRKATGRVLTEWAGHLTVALTAMWWFTVNDSLLLRAACLMLFTSASMGLLTITHTASHFAASKHRWLNELLTFVGYPLFAGVSAGYWWHKHLVLHHPAPNVVGVDGDIDLKPWFVRTRDEAIASSGWRQYYYLKLQAFVFPLAIPFILFNMQVAGWRWLAQKDGWTKKRIMDIAVLLLHYSTWIIVPVFFHSLSEVVAFYVLRLAALGYAMFAVLAPAHFPAETVCLDGPDSNRDPALLQAAGTLNFRTGWLGKMVCSGLQFQIEHHLIPNVSHVYLPRIAPLVREFCRKNGLPYRSYSWDLILWKSLHVFHAPPALQTNLEVSRIRE